MSESFSSRENLLSDTFVNLAGALVTGFDVVGLFDDLANACTELLQVSAAGLMLADAEGRLRVMASSNERSRMLELMEIQNDEGPCLDCYRGGAQVFADDLSAASAPWPRFGVEARRVGFAAAYALPMRLRDQTIGALNLFHAAPNAVPSAALRIAQGLADVATIAILQQRAVQRGTELSEQLQTALTSRLIIEQAKGVLAEREHTDMAAAFERLRDHARRTNQRLADVARQLVSGELASSELEQGPRRN
jgi:GAF domain-containing protein